MHDGFLLIRAFALSEKRSMGESFYAVPKRGNENEIRAEIWAKLIHARAKTKKQKEWKNYENAQKNPVYRRLPDPDVKFLHPRICDNFTDFF